MYDAASSSNALLSSALQEGNWIWAPARSDNLVPIQSKLCLIDFAEEDRPIRIPSKSGTHSCAETLKAIREKKAEVSCRDWYGIQEPNLFHWLAGHVELIVNKEKNA